MAWYLNKIPRVAHFYWGGDELSYLRFLTLKTFSKFNPNWKMKFYYPKEGIKSIKSREGKDYREEIPKIPNLEMIEIDFNAMDIVGIGHVNETWKSDILRLKLLGTEGGLWIDMDIIFFKSLDEICFNILDNFHIDTIFSYNWQIARKHYSIGFMGANKNNALFNFLYQKAIENNINRHGDYQQFGVILWGSYFPTPKGIEEKFPELNLYNIEMWLTYFIGSGHIEQIISENVPLTDERTIALHWYGGWPNCITWENKLTEDNIGEFNTTLCNTIRRALA